MISRAHSHSADLVTYLVCPSGRSRMIVVGKSFRNGHDPNAVQSLHDEFRALLSIEKQLGQELAGSVPRPLFFVENSSCECRKSDCPAANSAHFVNEPTLFTTFVEGVPFSHLLRREANALSGWLEMRMHGHLQRCSWGIGQWLDQFHQNTKRASRLHDCEAFMSRLAPSLNECVAIGLSRDVGDQVKQFADELSRAFANSPVDIAAVHGDFLPQNILIAGAHTRILDFASFCPEGPIYTDVSHFLAYLLILSKKIGYSRSAIENTAQNFLAGYHSKLYPGLLQLYVTLAIVRIFLDSSSRKSWCDVVEPLLRDVMNNQYAGLLKQRL